MVSRMMPSYRGGAFFWGGGEKCTGDAMSE